MWIKDDGETALAKFAAASLESETSSKEHEQDFEKFYFISMVSVILYY